MVGQGKKLRKHSSKKIFQDGTLFRNTAFPTFPLSLGNTMRLCNSAMGHSKGPAMPQHCVLIFSIPRVTINPCIHGILL